MELFLLREKEAATDAHETGEGYERGRIAAAVLACAGFAGFGVTFAL